MGKLEGKWERHLLFFKFESPKWWVRKGWLPKSCQEAATQFPQLSWPWTPHFFIILFLNGNTVTWSKSKRYKWVHSEKYPSCSSHPATWLLLQRPPVSPSTDMFYGYISIYGYIKFSLFMVIYTLFYALLYLGCSLTLWGMRMCCGEQRLTALVLE